MKSQSYVGGSEHGLGRGDEAGHDGGVPGGSAAGDGAGAFRQDGRRVRVAAGVLEGAPAPLT